MKRKTWYHCPPTKEDIENRREVEALRSVQEKVDYLRRLGYEAWNAEETRNLLMELAK